MAFGRKKDPAPSAPPPPPPPAPSAAEQGRTMRRENERAARKAARAMDSELSRLKQEESKIKAEMKKLAREGRVAEARILSKNLATNRKFQERCINNKYQMNSVAMQANMGLAMQQQATVIGTAAGIMAKANAAGDPQGTMAAVQRYEMESGKAEMNQEMMDDALDSAFGGVEVDEETDNILNEVLAEAGMEVGSKLNAAGPTPQTVPQHQAAMAAEDAELERRLAALQAPHGMGGGRP